MHCHGSKPQLIVDSTYLNTRRRLHHGTPLCTFAALLVAGDLASRCTQPHYLHLSPLDINRMNLIDEGTKRGLIRFEDGGKYIVYLPQGKRRNYDSPEEKVQAEAYLQLVLVYKYPVKRVRQYVSVQMGTMNKEADIIVYADDAHTAPHVVVECKSPSVSEQEFSRAADQAVSYAVAEGARFVWVTSRLKNEYFEIPARKPKARLPIPDVPQFGVDQLAKFKFAYEGGTTKTGQKLFPLEVVSEDELTRRFQQAHQALWGGGELNPSEAFDELDKLIFCKLWDERKPRKPGDPYDFQIFTEPSKEETERSLLERLQRLYEEGRKKDPEVFRDDIRLSAAKARVVVTYLEGVNLSETDLDSKGRAFETFMGSFFRGDFGQYFTPRPIVKFIVDVLPITDESRVLDTSCGSGGFLLHALDKVRRQADTFYKPGTSKHYRHWHDFAQHNLFGIEINEQIARTAKMNMIIHDDGHTNVATADGLLPADELRTRTKNQGFKESSFDFIITNPPFGSTVKQTEKAYLHQYRLATRDIDWLNPKSKAAERPGQDTEILFIEQCWHYLRAGGYLAIVIPDGILTNSSLQYVRDEIEDLFRIVAVVSLPQTAFTATGAGVKSSVLFLKKYTQEETNRIRDTKQSLKESIRKQEKLEEHLDAIEQEKKHAMKELDHRPEYAALSPKERKENAAYAQAASEISEHASTRVEELRYRLAELYQNRRQDALPDYDIFMAIAEDIGYDATGRPTRNNELEPIGTELMQFVTDIEEGKA
jgi:type I restriction enzyme M protein